MEYVYYFLSQLVRPINTKLFNKLYVKALKTSIRKGRLNVIYVENNLTKS